MDLSVRGAHLDRTHGFFNGTSVFLRVIGQEDGALPARPAAARRPRMRGLARVTALPSAEERKGKAKHGFGRYRAADYDELIDHPVEMGTFTLARFRPAASRTRSPSPAATTATSSA